MGVLAFTMLLGYVLYFSGAHGAELARRILGGVLLGAPFIAGFVVYSLAGWGLVRRKAWGYFFHVAGTILALFSCFGLLWTLIGLGIAMTPPFRAELLPPPAAKPSTG